MAITEIYSQKYNNSWHPIENTSTEIWHLNISTTWSKSCHNDARFYHFPSIHALLFTVPWIWDMCLFLGKVFEKNVCRDFICWCIQHFNCSKNDPWRISASHKFSSIVHFCTRFTKDQLKLAHCINYLFYLSQNQIIQFKFRNYLPIVIIQLQKILWLILILRYTEP